LGIVIVPNKYSMTWLIEFSIFLFLQALFINGIKYCFEKGSIFYKISPDFFERNLNKNWSYPVYKCVRCMASVYGTITFWVGVLIVYGWHWQEIPLFFFDLAILIPLNWIVYKKM
jgi:hypothetical protein